MILNALQSIPRKVLKFKKQRYIRKLVADGLKLGDNVSIVDDFFFDRAHCYLISIGDNTTIAPSVKLIAHDASTKKHLGYSKFGQINIGRNCFIGHSSIILPNVSIGDNSIIGSGSVVVKSIPEGSVAAGNPARVICSTEQYLAKVKKQKEGRRLFGAEYEISQLNHSKRQELLQESSDKIGYIV